MTADNILTTIIAIVFALTLSVPVFKILQCRFGRFNKVKIKSKSGETAELDFSKKNDVDAVINFADIFLGLK